MQIMDECVEVCMCRFGSMVFPTNSIAGRHIPQVVAVESSWEGTAVVRVIVSPPHNYCTRWLCGRHQ